MQKWEYLFVNCQLSGGAWRPHFVNGVESRNWQNNPDIATYSNEIGEQGWELVTVWISEMGAHNITYRLYFKRLKEQQQQEDQAEPQESQEPQED